MMKTCLVIFSLILSQQIIGSSSISNYINFKPGECPISEMSISDCSGPRNIECLEDDECRGDLKCCSSGCDHHCMNPTINRLWRSGQCPVFEERNDCPPRVSNECIVDIDCANGWKCCSDGCTLKCISMTKQVDKPIKTKPEPTVQVKLGKCPIFEEPLECPMSVSNDCLLDEECPGTRKCCDTGCYLVCVNHDGTLPSELKTRKECPAVSSDIRCTDRSRDQCRWDKQCFGGQKCCFDGCKFMCVGEPNIKTRNKCHKSLDIGLVIDTSGSLNQDDFNLAKYFLLKLISNFDVSNIAAHVSIISYGTKAEMILPFKQGMSKAAVYSAVNRIQYDQGESRLDLALVEVGKKMFKKHAGMRKHVPKYLIVVTDGKMTNSVDRIDVVKVADKIKKKGVEIYSVGVTSDVSVSTLIKITSSQMNLVKMSDYSTMMNYNIKLSQKICKKLKRLRSTQGKSEPKLTQFITHRL